MALMLNEEQSMLRDSARDFIAANAPIAHLRALRDARDPQGHSPALWSRFAEMGFAGVLVPESQGGMGLGCVEAGVIAEEIGRNLSPVPMLSTAVLGASMLVAGGNEPLKAQWLPKIAAGGTRVALAVDEASKHRPCQVAARAERVGERFRLSGAKTFVVDGHVADLLIVSARTAGADCDEVGITLFAVDPKAPGVTVERTQMVDAHNAARVRLEGVTVGADAVLGEIGAGLPLLESVLDVGRAVLAAEMLGIADEAFARTLAYLKERKQFGRLIGEFQALQHRAAHLYTEIEITRAAVIRALQAVDEGGADVARFVSLAKARAGTTVTLAVQEGVQMHGGMGMTDQFDIGLFMKRARVCQELLGDANFHADRLATAGGY